MDKKEIGKQIFLSGYNCAQAVFSTFSEDYGLDAAVARKIAGGLGGGVRSAEVCGAVTGAVLVIGLRFGQNAPDDQAGKENCYAQTDKFIKIFGERNNSIICRELLGCDIFTEAGREMAVRQQFFTTKCVDMVTSAIEILEEMGY